MAIPSDRILYMEERELYRMSMQMKEALTSMRKRSSRDNRIVKIETDLCYIDRELEIRESRRQAHREYKSSLSNKRSYRL